MTIYTYIKEKAMDKAEQRQIQEITECYNQINKTTSKQRQKQIYNRIRKLKSELREYRQLRYGIIEYH